MYIVTNRDVDPDASKPWSERIRKTPNRKGPNELRVLEATRSGGRWSVRIFEDDLTADMKREIGVDEGRDDVHAGTYVAFKLFRRVRDSKRNLLLYVHGFNNDLASVLDRAEGLARNYGVEVVPFSWPANGGGFKGTSTTSRTSATPGPRWARSIGSSSSTSFWARPPRPPKPRHEERRKPSTRTTPSYGTAISPSG